MRRVHVTVTAGEWHENIMERGLRGAQGELKLTDSKELLQDLGLSVRFVGLKATSNFSARPGIALLSSDSNLVWWSFSSRFTSCNPPFSPSPCTSSSHRHASIIHSIVRPTNNHRSQHSYPCARFPPLAPSIGFQSLSQYNSLSLSLD